jgi:nitrate/TMAO reductase-like tetraheme cytochrome c subunit
MGLRGLALATLAAPVLAASGWAVTDRLEQDDDFCNACHLSEDVPLHIEIRRDFDASPAASLASAHGAARAAHRDDGAFRCIDCHGGAGAFGRARVKALAAKDAFSYVIGHFEEPRSMRWPLRDEDCRACHASFEDVDTGRWGEQAFHALAVHNARLGVDCVECHLAHATDVDAGAAYLHTAGVRAQCARCHSEFSEED